MLRPPLNIPSVPGVYIFRDAKNKPLYIGKAVNLRARVRSYFTKRLTNPRLIKLVETATCLDWKTTESDIEALLLEAQLIKSYRPLFNISLRDDKQYAYVVITGDIFPRIFITHQPKQDPTGDYIGPFTDASALKIMLNRLRRAFPFCTCRQSHHRFCLNYHLEKCLGYCCLKTATSQTIGTKKAYPKNIKAVREILSGKKNTLLASLEKEMLTLAKHDRLETAIKLRDQLEKIRRIFHNATIISRVPEPITLLAELQTALALPTLPQRIESYDISELLNRTD